MFGKKKSPPPGATAVLGARIPGGQIALATGPQGPFGNTTKAAQAPAVATATAPRRSDQRYRSFAERYIIERVRNIPHETLQGDTLAYMHNLALEARSVYNLVKEVGYRVEDD